MDCEATGHALPARPTWDHLFPATGGEGADPRDVLWDHCRNILGIARLLVHERRPAPLVSTACYMAVDTACRVALAHAGLPHEADVERALVRLEAPEDVRGLHLAHPGPEQLARAERQVTWVASYLRAGVPERPWKV